ncbi:MAG: hypothetical protein NVSMB64_18500 [Candidatus Velthaea sp.]
MSLEPPGDVSVAGVRRDPDRQTAPAERSVTAYPQWLSLALPLFSAILVALVGAAGALYASYVSASLGSLTNAVEHSRLALEQSSRAFDEAKTLSQAMRDSIPVVTGNNSAKASMTVSTLYFLARDADSKAQVIEMAAFAQNHALNETLLKLLQGDETGREIAARPEIVGLIAFQAAPKKAKSAGTDAPPAASLQTDLLKTITAPLSAGWTYIGRGEAVRRYDGTLGLRSLDADESIVGTIVPGATALGK